MNTIKDFLKIFKNLKNVNFQFQCQKYENLNGKKERGIRNDYMGRKVNNIIEGPSESMYSNILLCSEFESFTTGVIENMEKIGLVTFM